MAKTIAAITARELDIEQSRVSNDATFVDDLNADSLETVRLVLAFEEEFGIEIPDEDAERIVTVGDAIDYIQSRLTRPVWQPSHAQPAFSVPRITGEVLLGNERRRRGARVFLCHAKQDRGVAEGLYTQLKNDGFRPWLDKFDLVPGQDWELEIRKAVQRSDAVVVCLSRNSINRRGFVHAEIRLALDEAAKRPDGTIFVIPLKLDDCALPDRLSKLHWAQLDSAEGYSQLIRALSSRPTGA